MKVGRGQVCHHWTSLHVEMRAEGREVPLQQGRGRWAFLGPVPGQGPLARRCRGQWGFSKEGKLPHLLPRGFLERAEGKWGSGPSHCRE